MYDVLNFLCIPVILSDDIIYAYSDQSGGPFNHSLFSIQLPQSLIYYTTLKQLSLYRNNKQLMGILPSGQLIYDLLESSYHQHGDYYYYNDRSSSGSSSRSSRSRSNNYSSIYINPLIHILQSISMLDIQILRNNMYHISSYYRYYQIKTSPTTTPTSNMSSSSKSAFTSSTTSTKTTTTTTTTTIMNQIPLIDHYFPDGDAMTMLTQLLSLRKKKGLYNISNQCQLERKGRKHNYISRFTCDNKDKDDILLHRRR